MDLLDRTRIRQEDMLFSMFSYEDRILHGKEMLEQWQMILLGFGTGIVFD